MICMYQVKQYHTYERVLTGVVLLCVFPCWDDQSRMFFETTRRSDAEKKMAAACVVQKQGEGNEALGVRSASSRHAASGLVCQAR